MIFRGSWDGPAWDFYCIQTSQFHALAEEFDSNFQLAPPNFGLNPPPSLPLYITRYCGQLLTLLTLKPLKDLPVK